MCHRNLRWCSEIVTTFHLTFYDFCGVDYLKRKSCVRVIMVFLLQLVKLSRPFGLSLQKLFESFDRFV